MLSFHTKFLILKLYLQEYNYLSLATCCYNHCPSTFVSFLNYSHSFPTGLPVFLQSFFFFNLGGGYHSSAPNPPIASATNVIPRCLKWLSRLCLSVPCYLPDLTSHSFTPLATLPSLLPLNDTERPLPQGLCIHPSLARAYLL